MNVVLSDQGAWQIDGEQLDPARRYLVAFNDYVLTGREMFNDEPIVASSEQEREELISNYAHLLKNNIVVRIGAATHVEALDNRRIPDALGERFRTFNVIARQQGSEWLIMNTGSKSVFFIQKSGPNLVVYDTFGSIGAAINDALERDVHVYKKLMMFNIDSKDNSDALDRKEIPDGLMDAFAQEAQRDDSASALSALASVSVSQKGSQWLITDTVNNTSTTYFLKQYRKKIIIYRTIDIREAFITQLKSTYQ